MDFSLLDLKVDTAAPQAKFDGNAFRDDMEIAQRPPIESLSTPSRKTKSSIDSLDPFSDDLFAQKSCPDFIDFKESAVFECVEEPKTLQSVLAKYIREPAVTEDASCVVEFSTEIPCSVEEATRLYTEYVQQ